jgi:hypothetical protein
VVLDAAGGDHGSYSRPPEITLLAYSWHEGDAYIQYDFKDELLNFGRGLLGRYFEI